MKVLSFSIFDSCGDWQVLFYIRGLYFNCAMAKIVYPDFQVHVIVERSVYIKYSEFFQQLVKQFDVKITIKDEESLCLMMLWRLLPVFDEQNEYVFCRDTDALVTFKEAKEVYDFVNYGQYTVNGLHDNPAHSLPLLGGMCGFKCQPLREKYGSYKEMIDLSPIPISKHGSDQDFLNQVIYNDFKKEACLQYNILSDKTNHLWLSDLCVFFIGAAGCNEFETLRYLRDKGTDLSFGGVGIKFSKIFYWV